MFLFILTACVTEEPFDTGSNLCGTISRPTGAPAASGVNVLSVLDGAEPCAGGDTGGSSAWWDEIVASPVPDGDRFEATVDPGTYGVEVYTDGDYAGCAAAEVADRSTCSADILVELGYEVQADKPNIYLYPTEPTDISVRIPAWRRITESEPRYPMDGWRVTAEPDGTLETSAGPRDYLFYEMKFDAQRFQHDEGWCVPGNLAQASIEDAMADMGFLQPEIDDFSEAWDSEFPPAPWMTVYPQVQDLAELRIFPAPDALLRAWFVVTDGCRPVAAPQITPVARTGYHAAEWGVAFEGALERPTLLVDGWR
jgi:hypothetical protein